MSAGVKVFSKPAIGRTRVLKASKITILELLGSAPFASRPASDPVGCICTKGQVPCRRVGKPQESRWLASGIRYQARMVLLPRSRPALDASHLHVRRTPPDPARQPACHKRR